MELIREILEVQTLLENYSVKLSQLSLDHVSDYSYIVSNGAYICEKILIVILKNQGYEFDENGHIDMPEYPQAKHMTIFSVACNAEALPDECRKFLCIIQKLRNNAVHGIEMDFDSAVEFAKAMDCFTIWFCLYVEDNKLLSESEFSKFQARIFSLENTLNNPKNKRVPLKEYVSKSFGSNILDVRDPSKVLDRLDDQTSLLERIEKKIDELTVTSKRIEDKIDEIDKQLKTISERINDFQKLTERQLSIALTEDEADRILQAYSDECVERITNSIDLSSEKKIYEKEKRNLINSLGEKAWNKMSDSSQSFLISAKVMFNRLILLDDIIDYSGICLLVTKAVEVEMKKRFYTQFLDYLDKTYHRNYSKYHSALLYQGKAPLNEGKFTMGSLAFVLCYRDDRYDSEETKENNREVLLDFANKRLFKNKNDREIGDLLYEYAVDVEEIRDRFRNPSAHTNELKCADAEQCFDLVVDVEKVLKKMLDSFDS